MSLDVYLKLPGYGDREPYVPVREDGQTKRLTLAEWHERYPDREPIVLYPESDYVFEWNITHNLNTMAAAAKLYGAIWRPDELDYRWASEIVPDLSAGLERLKADPDYYRGFNPSNGWGNYEQLVEFVDRYLSACIQYPDAEIRVSR